MPGQSFPRKRSQYGSYPWYQSQLGRLNQESGPDPASWSKAQIEWYHDIINRGAQRVYYLDDTGDGVLRHWSFLRSAFDIQTKSGITDLVLPEDCGGIIGNLAFDQSDSGYQVVVKVTPEQILEARAINTTISSYPQWYAERWFDDGADGYQKRQLMLWPNPDGNYTLNGTKNILPVDLDETHPFAYGGRPYVGLYLAAMLAILDPQMEGQFQQKLRAALQTDNTQGVPDFLGKNLNGNRQWGKTRDSSGRFLNFDPVTYNGSQ